MDLEPVGDELLDYNQYCSNRLNRLGDGVEICVKTILYLFTFTMYYSKRKVGGVCIFRIVPLDRETAVGSIYRSSNTETHYFIYFFLNSPPMISLPSNTITCDNFNIDLLKISLRNDMFFFLFII